VDVTRGRHWIGGLCGLAAATGMTGAAPMARAQQATPTPVPLPTQARPTLPNVTPERFTLAPPAATPTPTPTPVLAPPPVVPTPSAAATPRANVPARVTATATPAAATAPTRQSVPAPVAAPTPLAAPSPAATASIPAAPVATPSPQPLPQVAAPSSGLPGWLWALIGAGATALAFGGYWALRRRHRADAEDAIPEVPVAAPAPPRPVAPPPGIAPAVPASPAAPVAPSGEPFEIIVQPGRIEVTERDMVLDFELLIGNTQPSAAENIRVLMAMMSASPDQDRNIAGYHANPMVDSAGNPFDLAAGAGGRMPVRLALPRELIHVVEVHGRPMFVPMVMVELKWRAGISLRRFGADFMIGTPGQGGKIGPIWLDSNQQASQLIATRYLPRQAAAA